MNNKTFVCFFFFLETGLKIVHTVLKLATQWGTLLLARLRAGMTLSGI